MNKKTYTHTHTHKQRYAKKSKSPSVSVTFANLIVASHGCGTLLARLFARFPLASPPGTHGPKVQVSIIHTVSWHWPSLLCPGSDFIKLQFLLLKASSFRVLRGLGCLRCCGAGLGRRGKGDHCTISRRECNGAEQNRELGGWEIEQPKAFSAGSAEKAPAVSGAASRST